MKIWLTLLLIILISNTYLISCDKSSTSSNTESSFNFDNEKKPRFLKTKRVSEINSLNKINFPKVTSNNKSFSQAKKTDTDQVAINNIASLRAANKLLSKNKLAADITKALIKRAMENKTKTSNSHKSSKNHGKKEIAKRKSQSKKLNKKGRNSKKTLKKRGNKKQILKTAEKKNIKSNKNVNRTAPKFKGATSKRTIVENGKNKKLVIFPKNGNIHKSKKYCMNSKYCASCTPEKQIESETKKYIEYIKQNPEKRDKCFIKKNQKPANLDDHRYQYCYIYKKNTYGFYTYQEALHTFSKISESKEKCSLDTKGLEKTIGDAIRNSLKKFKTNSCNKEVIVNDGLKNKKI